MVVATPRLLIAALIICAFWAAVEWPWWPPAIAFAAAFIAGEFSQRLRRRRAVRDPDALR